MPEGSHFFFFTRELNKQTVAILHGRGNENWGESLNQEAPQEHGKLWNDICVAVIMFFALLVLGAGNRAKWNECI